MQTYTLLWDYSQTISPLSFSPAMQAILALDTSTDLCSVAFVQAGNVNSVHRELPRAHNQHVLAMVEEVLDGFSKNDIDGLVAGVGPGSFTGLRVAVSVAQGLAWALNVEVAGVCSLELLARTYLESLSPADRALLCVLDAQIGQVYGRLFVQRSSELTPVSEAFICKPQELLQHKELGLTERGPDTPIHVVGSGVELIEHELTTLPAFTWHLESGVRPSAESLARQALADHESLIWHKPWELQPHYVQKDVGWKKLGEQGSHG